MKPQNATFIISGGCSGLGLETARDLHKAGAYLLLLDVNSEAGSNAIKEFGEEKAKFVQTDVTDTSSIQAALDAGIKWIKATGKPIAGVIAAAGVALPGKVSVAITAHIIL